MSTLITGATGFIGRNLIAHLRELDPNEPLVTVGRHPANLAGTTHYTQDLTDTAGLSKLLARIRPSRIYHLAGGARVNSALSLPAYFESNFLPTARLAEALRELSPAPAIFFASSVHVYGNQSEIVTEESAPRPINPYGFSKYLAEELWRRFATERGDARVIVARLYTCIGPGQAEGFVVSDLCRRLAHLPSTPDARLKTGALSAFRRFVDIRDAVRFFPRLLEAAKPGLEIYNLASPHELRVDQIVSALIKVSGKSPRLESSESTSPNPFLGLKVSLAKLHAAVPDLEFRPIEETLRDTYAWARSETSPQSLG